jgi:hypothetical protein
MKPEFTVITFLTTLTPLARVVLRNDASPSDGDYKRLGPVTSFKLFIVHVHGYILVTIGSGFLFWNQNFCLQTSTVGYFNKVRYLKGFRFL